MHIWIVIWIYNSKLVKSKIVLDNGLLILLSELLAKISKQNNHSRYFDKSSKTKFSVETFTSKGGEKKIKLVDTIYDTVRKCGLCGSYPGFHPFFKYVSQH